MVITWVLGVAYVVGLVVATTNPSLAPGVMSIALNIVLVTTALVHGLSHYRLGDLAVYYVAVLIVANVMENTSIITGFPFGHYYYTSELGPKLFNVPIMIGIIYAAAGYFAWVVAMSITRVWSRQLRGGETWIVPLVAAFCMAAWDLSMDPIKSTIQSEWVWEDGGNYFGVPIQNWFGWFLTVWIFFQIFGLWMSRRGAAGTPDSDGWTYRAGKSDWLFPILIYFAMGLQAPLGALLGSTEQVTDGAGQVWSVAVIKDSLTLVTIFTMWAYSVFAVINVVRSYRR
ncbi:MAG: carotenoid biosynthesis protein [Candidatus Nanopelagicales bacterium]